MYLVSISYRESKVSREILEPQELRECLVKREVLAHLDPMEIQYVHIYHSYIYIAIIAVLHLPECVLI